MNAGSFRLSGEVMFAYMNFIETWIKKKTNKYANPQRMFQVKRKSLKCTRPRLEKKNTLVGFEPGASRCLNLCKTPTLPCHAEENVIFMVIPFQWPQPR